MTNKIIKIEPVPRVFNITWNLGLRCNFDCMYCPEYLHNLTAVDKTVDELKNLWLSVIDKTQHKKMQYKIAFTGGEVTVNKNFLPFVQWLDQNWSNYISDVGVTTNGSASKHYYETLINIGIIKFISFSVHSEFFNEKKFFEVVISIHSMAKKLNKSIHVNIMNEYWNTENIKRYCDFLAKNNINHSVNEIHYEAKIRDHVLLNKNKQKYHFNE